MKGFTLRLFGYVRTSTHDCRQHCTRCWTMNEVDADTPESQCRQCEKPLHWRFSLFSQRERIAAFCDERFPDVPRAGVLCEVCGIADSLADRPHLADLIGTLREGDILVVADRHAAWGRWTDAEGAIGKVFDKGASIAFAGDAVVFDPADDNSLAMFDLLMNTESEQAAARGQNVYLDAPRGGEVIYRKTPRQPPGYTIVCRWCFLNGEKYLPRLFGRLCAVCRNPSYGGRICVPDKEELSLYMSLLDFERKGWNVKDIERYLKGVRCSDGRNYTECRLRTSLKKAKTLTPEHFAELVAYTGAEPLFTGDPNEIKYLADRIHEASSRFIRVDRPEDAFGAKPVASQRWAGCRRGREQGSVRGIPRADVLETRSEDD